MLDMIGSGAASILGGVIDAGMGIWTQKEQAKEAKKAREFSREMSNTAWQRGVADMRAAGLNPILAASKGAASSPTGAQASLHSLGDVGTKTANSAMAARMNTEQMKAVQAGVENTQAQTEKARADTQLSLSQSQVNSAMQLKILDDIKSNESQRALNKKTGFKYDQEIAESLARISQIEQNVASTSLDIERKRAENLNLSLRSDVEGEELRFRKRGYSIKSIPGYSEGAAAADWFKSVFNPFSTSRELSK